MKKVKLFEEFVNEALKSETPNEVTTIDLDMAWDDSDPEEDKAAKAAFKKYKIKVESDDEESGTYFVTGKKKDILAYLQSEFYEMDDETIEEYYPELLESVVNEDKIKMALDNIDKWMPDDAQLQDEYYELINDGDVEGMKDFLDTYAEEDGLMKYGIKYKDLDKLAKAAIGEAIRLTEASTGAVDQFAADERADGYDAKVFLGRFDGKITFKAQSTNKTWGDGTPVTKYFSRGGYTDVKLKGEYQLVDSDRGWWYIQGPAGVWYAVEHDDYGTPPFEF